MTSTQPDAVTLSNAAVLGALSSIEVLQQAEADGSFKLRLARIAAVLRAEDKLIKEQLQKLQLKSVELDAEGNPKPMVVGGREMPGTVVWLSKPAFDKAAEALLNAEVTITVLRISEADLGAVTSFKGSIEFLLPLLAA